MSDTTTDEARAIAAYIERTWPKHFHVDLAVRLSRVFTEPENKGLRHIWRYGEADMVVFRGEKPVALIEPGGGQHFEDKQSLNDRRKWKLAELNGVRCLNLMNGFQERLSKRQWRALIGRQLFGTKESEEKTPKAA